MVECNDSSNSSSSSNNDVATIASIAKSRHDAAQSHDQHAKPTASSELFMFAIEPGSKVDALQVKRELMHNAPLPMLRAFVLALHVEAHLHETQANYKFSSAKAMHGNHNSSNSDHNTVLHMQMHRLEVCALLLVALQVAAHAGEHALLQETVVNVYNCLAPLLALQDKHPALAKLLGRSHLQLQELVRADHPHVMQVAATITYNVTDLFQKLHEDEIVQHFAQLDMDILQSSAATRSESTRLNSSHPSRSRMPSSA